MSIYSFLIYDPADAERTQLTEVAHEIGREALLGQVTAPVQVVVAPSGQPYVLEIHGQSSVTGHGKQGLRPRRLATLHETGLPVLLVFVEGKTSMRRAWLHDLPPARAIALGDPADRERTQRFGWPVSLMEKVETLVLPEDVPEPAPAAQASII